VLSPSTKEGEGLHHGSPQRVLGTEPPSSLLLCNAFTKPSPPPALSFPQQLPGAGEGEEGASEGEEGADPPLPASPGCCFFPKRIWGFLFFLNKSTHLCWEKLPFNSPLVSCSLMFHIPAWDPGLSVASEKLLSLPSRRPGIRREASLE